PAYHRHWWSPAAARLQAARGYATVPRSWPIAARTGRERPSPRDTRHRRPGRPYFAAADHISLSWRFPFSRNRSASGIEMFDVDSVDMFLVMAVMPNHRPDGGGVEHQQHQSGDPAGDADTVRRNQ